jgi:PGAP1-like protein
MQGVAALAVAMASIPGVWVSAEHSCTVWCNQLAAALSRLLLNAAASSQGLGVGVCSSAAHPLICHAASAWGLAHSCTDLGLRGAAVNMTRATSRAADSSGAAELLGDEHVAHQGLRRRCANALMLTYQRYLLPFSMYRAEQPIDIGSAPVVDV